MNYRLISFNSLEEIKEYMRNTDNFVCYRNQPLDLAPDGKLYYCWGNGLRELKEKSVIYVTAEEYAFDDE